MMIPQHFQTYADAVRASYQRLFGSSLDTNTPDSTRVLREYWSDQVGVHDAARAIYQCERGETLWI